MKPCMQWLNTQNFAHLLFSVTLYFMDRVATHRVAVTVLPQWGLGDDLVRGVLDYCRPTHHWRLVGTEAMPFSSVADVDLADVDGVIGFFHTPESARGVIDAQVPAVNISNRSGEVPLPRVGADDTAIGQLGARHLIERGFSEFAFIAQGDSWYSQRRLAGFRALVEQASGRPCHVLTVPSRQLVDAEALIAQWLPSTPRPIAVMAAHDHLAHQTINAAVSLGSHVPNDVAVLGVDNDKWADALADTPLTTIDPDWRQAGYRAAMTLAGLMRGEASPPAQWVAPAGVIAQRSTNMRLASDPLVRQALHYIRDHCGEPIDVGDVLAALGVSRSKLESRMKQATGQTPHLAICRARIDKAERLLTYTDESIEEVSRSCGFSSQARLSVVFKRLIGTSPSRYRQQRRIQGLHQASGTL